MNTEKNNNKGALRAQLMTNKQTAVWQTLLELDEVDGLINSDKFAEIYLERTKGWLERKLSGKATLNPGEYGFTPEEFKQVTAGLRDLAKRLNEYADAIDAAQMP